MDATTGTALVQVGLLLGCVVLVQVASVRLAQQEIPVVLRSRVAWSSRLSPWIAAFSAALVLAGLAALALPR